MKLFESWSGIKSAEIAKVLSEWVPCIIQGVEVFYSKDGIEKGERWSGKIAKELEESNYGIVILTRDNLNSPWIHFEAGALSKRVNESRCTGILFGVKEKEIKGPLGQFQLSAFTKEEVLKIFKGIKCAGDLPITDSTLEKLHNALWDEYSTKINAILSKDFNDESGDRSDEDILAEILHLVRRQSAHSYKSNDFNDSFKSVVFDPTKRLITIKDRDNNGSYPIELDRISSGSELTDWIFQLNGKSPHPEVLSEFINCIEDLCGIYLHTNAQGAFCPFGKNQQVKWPKNLKERK